MPDKTYALLGIFRLLSLEYQADLISLVRLGYVAENSVRKSLGLDDQADVFPLKTQDCFCEKSLKRRKK